MKEVEKLIQGYHKFHQEYFVDNPDVYAQLVRGQTPKFLFISCCDSRINPTQIFHAEPGEMFIVRNVANLVPPYNDDGETHGTSAALQFAVEHLKVRHIVVMGHSQCGGIHNLMTTGKGEHTGFIQPWMDIVSDAKEQVLKKHANDDLAQQCLECERAAIQVSLENLQGFPFIKQAVDEDRVILHGWHFDIQTGQLSMLDNGVFNSVITQDLEEL